MTKDEALKQLIKDLISAMEYHVEQTRPVHMTTVAIQTAKDALKAMSEAPVQEPVAMTFDEAWASLSWQEWRMKSPKELFAELHRLTTPPAAPVQPVASLLSAIQAEPVTLIHKWRVLELVKEHAAQPAPVPEPDGYRSLLRRVQATLKQCEIGFTGSIGSVLEDVEAMLTTPPAAPVQEPVAWLEIMRNNKTATDEVIGAFLRGHAEHLTGETFVLAALPAAPVAMSADWFAGMPDEYRKEALRIATPPAAPVSLTERELELIDGMIEVQLRHAEQCDGIANRTMAARQKGWDMKRIALLKKLKEKNT